METQNSELLKVPEVAAMLRVKTRTAYRLAERNEIPSIKVGRLVRFKKTEIEQYLNRERSQQATA